MYDGDGRRVAQTINGVTTYFVGGHYEVTGSQVTKYYFAGTTRIAMRKYTIPQNMTVEYFLGDHLGSTSITTDANGAKVSEMRYKAWGEARYSWTSGQSTTPAYKLANYTYTGQYSHTADFGLMFYNARWYDPALGRFAQADTIVPGGVQGLDRYAYVNNAPVRYTDPSGHRCVPEDECESPFGDRNRIVSLSEGAQKLLDFASKFGVKPENVIIAALAGEAGGWANNPNIMSQKEKAWGLHYQWYVKTFCYGIDMQNCKLNFYMTYSQSVRDSVNNLWNAPPERVQLMMNERYYGEANWSAGVQLYNAVQNPRPAWISFDPDNNPDDRNQVFDVDILPASITWSPSIGRGYDQFAYYANTIYRGVDSYSVILTYCQWQYWVNGKPALNGCYPAIP